MKEMKIDSKRIKSYELISFFIRAMQAENYSKLTITLVVPLLVLFILINFLFLNFPYRYLQRIVDIRYVFDQSAEDEILGGYITVDKLKQRNYLYFGGFFIRPQYQEKGIGTIVLQNVLLKYPDVDIRLDVDVANTRAKSLYEKLGFEVLGSKNNEISMIKHTTNNFHHNDSGEME